MSESGADPQELIVRKFYKNRLLAHQVLFKSRHPDITPPFHRSIIRSWHSAHPLELYLVFRGGAKSTIAEEGIVLNAGFREFRNGIIIGDILDRAVERLTAIKSEIENNEDLAEVFGDLKGNTWGADEIVTSTGIRILAMGRGQSIRGIKFNDMRPDFVFVDDLENEESVSTPQAREKTKRWFMKELLPALDPSYLLRMAATPLDKEALPMELQRTGEGGFNAHIYPIEYKGENGERVATWPDRFPLARIDKIKANYARIGMMAEYNMEYMVQADDPKDRVFKAEQFRVEPTIRTWQNTYAMFDPARTIGRNAATTGAAVWSWIGSKLIVWDAWGDKLLPDEIVNRIFSVNDEFRPAMLYVEEDGLEQWLMQPIRAEASKRNIMLPVMGVRAPQGKMDFIKSMQPFFAGKEVIWAKELPDLRGQLLSFPSGAIDIPNALAYAYRLRPGAPVYDGFGARHVQIDMSPSTDTRPCLAMNATKSLVTAVLMQSFDGAIRIYDDWIREGDPALIAGNIIADAMQEARGRMRIYVPPHQFDRYLNTGLVQAIRKVPEEARRGVEPDLARKHIQDSLDRERRGSPAILICEDARFTLNAFAGAYARKLNSQGMLAAQAEENIYRTLMEGVESYAGLSVAQQSNDDNPASLHYDTTPDGRRFMSARR